MHVVGRRNTSCGGTCASAGCIALDVSRTCEGTESAQRRRVRKTLLLAFVAFLPAISLAQECVDVPSDAAAVLTADLLAARSFRAGEANVPFAKQKKTLDEILRRMGARQRERKDDPSLPKLVVMIDLDNTSFVPTERVHAGLRRIANQHGIVEVADPSALDVLPHYSKDGFLAWADELGLRTKYPNLNWSQVYTHFNGSSWVGNLDGTETLTPGLVKFARRVSQSGGVVVFNTARRESQRAITEQTLRNGGIPNPKVTMKPNSGFSGSSAEWKVVAAKKIEETWGQPIALIDETAVNHVEMNATYPDMLDVAISIPGFTTEMTADALAAREWAVSTFER
jgi:hypothetical protein